LDNNEFNYQDKLKRSAFVFAHPDDDVFISGLMRRLISAGSEILGVWLTSGGFLGGQERRETELRSAVSILGLEKKRYELLRFPDLGLMRSSASAAETLKEIFVRFKPDNVFVTAFEGGHPDHDAANFIVYESRFRSMLDFPIFEFPLYNGAGPFWSWRWRINAFPSGGPETLFIPLDSSEVDCKFNIMRVYSSQWMYMAPAFLARSRNKLITQGEPYRKCPKTRDHSLPPHAGKLNYERWFNSFMKIRFSDFSQSVIKTRTFRTLDHETSD
jgi:N-acetylglucosamine malate deacetylase 1